MPAVHTRVSTCGASELLQRAQAHKVAHDNGSRARLLGSSSDALRAGRRSLWILPKHIRYSTGLVHCTHLVFHVKRCQHELFCLLHHLAVEVVRAGRAPCHGGTKLEQVVLARVVVNPVLPELKAMLGESLQAVGKENTSSKLKVEKKTVERHM